MGWPRNLARRSLRARTRREKALSRLINKLASRKHILAFMIKRKLEQNQSLSDSERAYVKRSLQGEHKVYVLSKTKHGLLGANQVAELNKRSKKSPIIMFRSTTLTGPRHTNGFTTSILFIPSAYLMGDRNSRRVIHHTSEIRISMMRIPLQILRPMLGQHLLWRDRIQDQLLSWTMSYNFAIVHLYLRHLKGQEVACVSAIDRTRATHPDWHDSEPVSQVKHAKFYSANDLCDTTGVYHDHDWPCSKDLPGLHPRKTNHEYITHGVVKYPEGEMLQQATWGDLVAAGIFALIPELKVPPNLRAAGLYTVLRYIRTTNYNTIYRTTDQELAVAQAIAWLHTRLQPGEIREQSKPNLWMLLYALTFRKRDAGDQLFQKLIRSLDYKRHDLDQNLYAGFGTFPANLPEMESLYYLAIDVQTVVGGQPLRPLTPKSTYSELQLPGKLEGKDDTHYDKVNKPRLTRSIDGYECTRTCNLPCNCNIWTKIPTRRQAGDEEDDDNGSDDENDRDEEEAN